ncbi:unnamed protein product [Rhizophagus irregularis]|nr:unnamed protein product [Rhizophagus irregularis]
MSALMLCQEIEKFVKIAVSKVVVTPSPPAQNTFKDYNQVKQVINKRIGVTYTKKVSMHSEKGNYLVTYSNLRVNKQFKIKKEQEKYKKRFKNSLKSNKNKWQYTSNGFKSKLYMSKHRLRRKSDTLKKQYILEKELEFLIDQVTSETGYNMLKEKLFLAHSFNDEFFLELRKKKEAAFKLNSSNTVDNITTDLQKLEINEPVNVALWQQILGKEEPVTRPEFHRGLNSIRDLQTLTTYSDGVRNKKRAYGVTHNYVIAQCAIRARKIKEGL